ncbi:hypothetical protein JCM11672_26870 [Alkaliphilus crotonatoxidans]
MLNIKYMAMKGFSSPHGYKLESRSAGERSIAHEGMNYSLELRGEKPRRFPIRYDGLEAFI